MLPIAVGSGLWSATDDQATHLCSGATLRAAARLTGVTFHHAGRLAAFSARAIWRVGRADNAALSAVERIVVEVGAVAFATVCPGHTVSIGPAFFAVVFQLVGRGLICIAWRASIAVRGNLIAVIRVRVNLGVTLSLGLGTARNSAQ